MSGATLEQFAKPELIDHIRNAKTDELPLAVAAELPDWVIEKLRPSMSDADILALGRALQQQAPLDVRVNAFRADRDTVLAQLRAEGLVVETSVEAAGARPPMDRPSSVMVPVVGRFSPERVRSVVVLPAPLAPISVTILPAGTSRLMPRRARMPP